jgi:ribonuclease P protein component
LGLAVSKNVGNAVMRNHVKRRFRQLAKEYESQLPEQCDIVIRAKPRAGKASFAMLQTQVQRLFTEIGTRAQREQCAPAAGDNHARGFVQ